MTQPIEPSSDGTELSYKRFSEAAYPQVAKNDHCGYAGGPGQDLPETPIAVIIADDHAMFRQAVAPLLQARRDIRVLAQADNGTDAWSLIKTLRPDVAILDISMPGATGIEVARKVDAEGLDTRIVLLTMHNDLSAVLQALDAGVAGYVLKDNSFDELVMAVQTTAAGGTFITPSIRTKLCALKRSGRTTATLSAREREVIRLIALGRSGKEIASAMDISPRTVDTYRNRLMRKLELRSLADVVRYAMQAGMVA
jgi:DNA-binding NarL/FixJ family response regulator